MTQTMRMTQTQTVDITKIPDADGIFRSAISAQGELSAAGRVIGDINDTINRDCCFVTQQKRNTSHSLPHRPRISTGEPNQKQISKSKAKKVMNVALVAFAGIRLALRSRTADSTMRARGSCPYHGCNSGKKKAKKARRPRQGRAPPRDNTASAMTTRLVHAHG